MSFFLHAFRSLQVARTFLLICSALTAVPLLSQAQTSPAFPDTPAGRALARLTEAVNTDSDSERRAFVEHDFSAAARKEQTVQQIVRCLQNVHRRTGKMTWDVVYPQNAAYIGAFAWGERTPYRKQDGTRIFVRLETRSEAPHPIDRFEFSVEEAPLAPLLPYPPTGASEARRLKAVRKASSLAAKAGRFSGVILIQREGKPLLFASYGKADREFHVPNQPTTRFQLASVGKVFTVVAAAQLVAAGKLRYDLPIRTYLPDYPQPAVADKITLRHLLTHTSGLGDIFGPGKDDPNHRFQTLADYLPLFAGEPLQFEPGHGNAYSNAGLLLVSLIIERVSGMPYEAYLHQHIFSPAGMTGVEYAPVEAVRAERAIGYMEERDEDPLSPTPLWKSNLRFLVSSGTGPATGAGGGWATASDMGRFGEALLQNHLVPEPLLEELVRGGMGFEVDTMNGHERFGHTGAGPGMNTSFFVYPAWGYTIVVLSNVEPAFAQTLADRVGDVMTRP